MSTAAESPATPSPAAPQVERHTPGPIELLWRALNSLPVAIYVMLALTLLSSVGTMIPQRHLNPQPPGLTYEQFAIQRYGEQKYAVLHALGLDHVYFTWYFNTLLIWLAVSAVICNIVRYRRTMQLWRTPPVRRGARFFAADRRSMRFSADNENETVAAASSRRAELGTEDGGKMPPPQGNGIPAPALAEASPEQVADALEVDLRAIGYRVRREVGGADTPVGQEGPRTGVSAQPGAICLYADRGFTQKWALVLLHVAILVLLFGGMAGHAVGIVGTVRLADGEVQTLTTDPAQGKLPSVQPLLAHLPKLSFELHQHKFRIDYAKKILLETDLRRNVPPELQEYYEYLVRDFVSDLEVSHQGATQRREVKVNHPLIVDKLYLYQNGYDQRGYISVTRSGKADEYKVLIPNEWLALTPSGLALWSESNNAWAIPREEGADITLTALPPGVKVSSYSFKLDQVKAGDLYQLGSKVGYLGPLTIATLRDTQTKAELGSLILDPQRGFDMSLDGQPVSVRMARRVDNYSVFAYKRDPLAPVLLIGWLLLVAGIAVALYVPFTQVWARCEPGQLHLLALGHEGGRNGRLRRRVGAMVGEDQP